MTSNGLLIASYNTSSPILFGSNTCEAFNKAIPPPGNIPCFIAAFVAQIASSALSLFSFSSTSELAPTLTTATLPVYLANLFSNFIIRLGSFVLFIFVLTLLTALLTSSFEDKSHCNIVFSLLVVAFKQNLLILNPCRHQDLHL
jgi:hypothetical protein